jgi:hypothetical protein
MPQDGRFGTWVAQPAFPLGDRSINRTIRITEQNARVDARREVSC